MLAQQEIPDEPGRTRLTAPPSTKPAKPSSLAASASGTMKTRATVQQRRQKTPNCTHINMDRVYGRDQHCFVCGRSPSIGFLYVCRQDATSPSLFYRPQEVGEKAEGGCVRTDLRKELEEVGLSESVIQTAERGLYTDAQLEKLKKQKIELRQAISDIVGARKTPNAAVDMEEADLANRPSTDGAWCSVAEKEPILPFCRFQACHTCRPYYKDRIYLSFPALVSPSMPPLQSSEASKLPTKDAHILSTIGLLAAPRPHPPGFPETSPSTLPTSTDISITETDAVSISCASTQTFKTTQTDISILRRMKRPRRRFYNLGNRSSGSIARDLATSPLFTRRGLKTAIQGIFKSKKNRESKESNSMTLEPDSNITLPLPRTGTARKLTAGESGERVGEFDVGSLRRVRRQKERVDLWNGTCTSSFELYARPNLGHSKQPSNSTDGQDEETLDAAMEADNESGSENTESDFTVYSCPSEGSEVEVSGGVALTEEAIEMHTPDILNIPASAESKEAELVSLDKIMTQL